MKTLRFLFINRAARLGRISGRNVLRFARNSATQILYNHRSLIVSLPNYFRFKANDRLDDYANTAGNTPAAQTRRLLAMRHRQWLGWNERRLQMRKRWEEFFRSWDAILLPVMPCPAIPHDHSEPQASRVAQIGGEQRSYWSLITWMAPSGACYLPATVVPVGFLSNGLPVGVQIVGPYLEDRTTLDIARHLLSMVGGCPRPPGF